MEFTLHFLSFTNPFLPSEKGRRSRPATHKRGRGGAGQPGKEKRRAICIARRVNFKLATYQS
jgi:hypothetical protein